MNHQKAHPIRINQTSLRPSEEVARETYAGRISDETIEYIGILAQLELSSEEKEQAKSDMEQMLSYFDQMKELDTEGIEPMSHIFPVENVFRQDVVADGSAREEILTNAPWEKNGCFQVPKTL